MRADGSRQARAAGLALVVAVVVAACGQPVATPAPVYLRAAGSTTLGPLVVELAAAFHKQAPAITLEIAEAGTGYGLQALTSGELDIALASWLPPDLHGRETTAIARDALAVVVHPDNPVAGLGLLQVRDLFSGQVYDWAVVGGRADLGTVQPVSREEGSGTRAAFEALVMEGGRLTPRAAVAVSSKGVVDYVGTHPAAIGYTSAAFVSPAVKVLLVEGEQPTQAAARRGSYPLVRDLWLVTALPPSPAVRQFIDFCLSPAGQDIVARRYIPVR